LSSFNSNFVSPAPPLKGKDEVGRMNDETKKSEGGKNEIPKFYPFAF
jgi:hypothetical protein